MANNSHHTRNGNTQVPFKFLIADMFANIWMVDTNYRIRAGRTTKLQGREYSLARLLTGAIAHSVYHGPSFPRIFGFSAFFYFPLSQSCWVRCLSGSHLSSWRVLRCVGSLSPFAGGITSWVSHPDSAQVDFWISPISPEFATLRTVMKTPCAQNLSAASAVSVAAPFKSLLTRNP